MIEAFLFRILNQLIKQSCSLRDITDHIPGIIVDSGYEIID